MKWCSWIPARKHLGLGLALVLAVTLVTLLFSFLGTLSCCVLVAMMSGASKQWRWHAILISLVFPTVLLTFAPIPRIGLPWHETLLLSGLCLGVFWVTYLLTCALMCLETPGGQAPAKRAVGKPGPREPAAPPPPAGAAGPSREGAEPAALRRAQSWQPEVAELQGTWSRQDTAAEGEPGEKILEVTHNQLALRITDVRGQVRLLSEGDVRIERLGPLKILKVLAPGAAAPAVSAEPSGLLWTWVYQLAGQTLKVAVNFDGTAEGRPPVIETYVKTGDSNSAPPPRSQPG